MACETGVAYLKGKINDLSIQLTKIEDVENSLRHEIMILKTEKDSIETVSENLRCELDSTILLNKELTNRLEEEKLYSNGISERLRTLDESLDVVQHNETLAIPKLKALQGSNAELEKSCSLMLNYLKIFENLLTDNVTDQHQIHDCINDVTKMLTKTKKDTALKNDYFANIERESNMIGDDIQRIGSELQEIKQKVVTSLADSKYQIDAVENISMIADNMQSQLESVEDKNIELEAALRDSKMKVSHFEEELYDMRRVYQEKDEEIAEKARKLSESNDEIKEISTLLNQEREEKAAKISDFDRLNQEFTILQDTFIDHQKKLENMQKENEILVKENEKSRIELQLLERDTYQSDKIKELMSEEEELFYNRWQELRIEQDKLLSDYEELNTRHVVCETDLLASREKCKLHEINRKKLMNEVSKWRLLHANEIERLKALEMVAKEYQTKYIVSYKELSESKEKFIEIQKKLDDTVNELLDTKKLVIDLKNSLEQSEIESKDVLANYANQNIDVGVLRAESKILEEAKSLTVKQCQTLQEELTSIVADKETCVSHLQKQCNSLELELKEQKCLVDTLKTENKEYCMEVNRLVNEKDCSLDAVTLDAKDLRKQLHKLKREHNSNLVKLKECDKELTLKTHKTDDFSEKMSKLEEEITRKSDEIEILKNENRDFEIVLEQYRSELIETQEQWRCATTDILDQVLKATTT